MKGKLVKIEDGYELLTQGFLKGSTNHKLIDSLNVEEGNIRYKLSLKNCQAVERGYDLDKIFQREIDELMFTWNLDNPSEYRSGMYKGADILLKLMGDKKFSEEDLMEAYSRGQTNSPIQSLQQTEWDVTVEMEYVGECNGNNDEGCFQDSPGHNCGCFERRPKLDADGCLILKRIWKEN